VLFKSLSCVSENILSFGPTCCGQSNSWVLRVWAIISPPPKPGSRCSLKCDLDGCGHLTGQESTPSCLSPNNLRWFKCIFPSKTYMLKPITKVMILDGEAAERHWGHKGFVHE
jgi:hypothetical protein